MDKNSKNIDTPDTMGKLFSLTPIKNRQIEVSFTAPDLSSQGGLLLMNEYEQHHGFIGKLTGCIEDTRHQPFVQHSYYEMLRQRIFQIAAGYQDFEYIMEITHLPLLRFSGQAVRTMPFLKTHYVW